MRMLRLFAGLFAVILLSSCAGVGIVATSDPGTKLSDAEELFKRQERPLPAERLIREAITIYQDRDDPRGQGMAYSMYGDLLRSYAVAKWEKVYRRDGFQDKFVTFDNRMTKATEFYKTAITYYERAAHQFRESGKYDALTNVYFNMGHTYSELDEREKACDSYDHTVEAYKANLGHNPSAKPYVPPGAGSVLDSIAAIKRQLGCQ